MSVKLIVFVALVAGSGYMLTRTPPPIPPGSTAADSTAIAKAGYGARFKYGVGSLFCWALDGTVRGMVTQTEVELKDLRKDIEQAKGGDGLRAQKTSKRIIEMDSVAIFDLEYGRPVDAVRGAMEAKSLLNSVRVNLKRAS